VRRTDWQVCYCRRRDWRTIDKGPVDVGGECGGQIDMGPVIVGGEGGG
jgi:hypothetical protein